ncbi:ABC transporter permease [Rhodococcus sp. (in: high G+C Gram-positive bacteria)]|uniref:ABC transporter permease n=1 Tax=unclassified Rhodococcus (in: high G+C Gram-positive bacteria) TaxID=192944 RepID=UPI0019DD7559|nr:ABC transporter permease [Rhodococcus sp. (in: high G+C Gram-positive bacteria)]MBF0662416.1 ABC transporter permease [Rhodococcus sp. (in: high G+C Gram-positive bacteria)]
MTQVALEKKDEGRPVDEVATKLPDVPAVKKTRSILVYLSIAWLVIIIGAAVFAGLLPLAPYNIPIGPPRTPPGFGSLDTLLGTDTLGRSLLSRVVYGAQVSLVIGAVAGTVGFVVGSLFGMIAGYFGKRVDAVISLVADAMLAFPPLILLLALASILTPSVQTMLFGLGLLAIPSFIRLSRANTLAWSSREFVRAAKNMGAGNGRILFREIMPNVLAPLASYMPIVIAALIVAEGSLSFLGLGIPPPQPSWGGMINDGKDAIATSPHLVFVPALVIFFTVFALNQVGDHLRTKYDRTLHD